MSARGALSENPASGKGNAQRLPPERSTLCSVLRRPPPGCSVVTITANPPSEATLGAETMLLRPAPDLRSACQSTLPSAPSSATRRASAVPT